MTNKEYFKKVFEQSEEMISDMIGQYFTATGVPFAELDPEMVKLWNRFMSYWNDMKNDSLAWAMTMDAKQRVQEEKIELLVKLNKEIQSDVAETKKNVKFLIGRS